MQLPGQFGSANVHVEEPKVSMTPIKNRNQSLLDPYRCSWSFAEASIRRCSSHPLSNAVGGLDPAGLRFQKDRLFIVIVSQQLGVTAPVDQQLNLALGDLGWEFQT